MARPSVIPAIRERLETYLDECELIYQQQPEDTRMPTIPATPDGKVNVRAVATAIGLKTTQEKYLYEREELSSLVNVMAAGQGLAPIGARLMLDAADRAVTERARLQAQTLRHASQAATEAEAMRDELLQTIKDLGADNQRLQAEVMRLRARLDAVEIGIFIPADD